MSRAKEFLEDFNKDDTFLPQRERSIQKAFEDRLEYFDLEGVSVAEVSVDAEGDIIVTFAEDGSDDEMVVLFTIDDEEGPVATIVGEEEDEEIFQVDLGPVNPVIDITPFGPLISLTDLSWMNKTTLLSLFNAGDIGVADERPLVFSDKDAYGFRRRSLTIEHAPEVKEVEFTPVYEGEELVEQSFAVRVRGGQRVKLPVVRRKRRVRLTPKQKQGIRKAARKRKAQSSKIQRKRKRSLKVRKRLGLKKGSLRKNRKVRG